MSIMQPLPVMCFIMAESFRTERCQVEGRRQSPVICLKEDLREGVMQQVLPDTHMYLLCRS